MNTVICPSCGASNQEGADACANCGEDLTKADLPAPDSPVERSVMRLPLTALDLTPVHAIGPDESLESAARMLLGKKVDLLEVVEDGRLIGLLSVRDLVTRAGSNYRSKLGRPVREFMTAKPETLPPEAPIAYAINVMDVGGYRHVPVVRDGRTIGVASSRAVVRYVLNQSRKSGQ